MNLAFRGTIAKNANNHVKSARIAKPAKDVCGVSSQAPVSMRQPGLQPGENTHVVRRDDRLSHLELAREHRLALELPQQLENGRTLLAVTTISASGNTA
jgi:hypothetical protein